MRRMMATTLAAALSLGCGGDGRIGDGRDDKIQTEDDGKGDVPGTINPWSREAWGALAVANQATADSRHGFDLLYNSVRLTREASAAMVAARAKLGRPFKSVEELAAVDYIGPNAFGALIQYATNHGLVPSNTNHLNLPSRYRGATITLDGTCDLTGSDSTVEHYPGLTYPLAILDRYQVTVATAGVPSLPRAPATLDFVVSAGLDTGNIALDANGDGVQKKAFTAQVKADSNEIRIDIDYPLRESRLRCAAAARL